MVGLRKSEAGWHKVRCSISKVFFNIKLLFLTPLMVINLIKKPVYQKPNDITDFDYHYYFGRLLGKLGRYDEAMDSFVKAHQQNPCSLAGFHLRFKEQRRRRRPLKVFLKTHGRRRIGKRRAPSALSSRLLPIRRTPCQRMRGPRVWGTGSFLIPA